MDELNSNGNSILRSQRSKQRSFIGESRATASKIRECSECNERSSSLLKAHKCNSGSLHINWTHIEFGPQKASVCCIVNKCACTAPSFHLHNFCFSWQTCCGIHTVCQLQVLYERQQIKSNMDVFSKTKMF